MTSVTRIYHFRIVLCYIVKFDFDTSSRFGDMGSQIVLTSTGARKRSQTDNGLPEKTMPLTHLSVGGG